MSFDVVSLFTTIPINLAKQIVYDRLSFDDELPNRTNLTVSEIMAALDICFDSTNFVYKGVTYQQVFGTPMGSLKTFHSPPMCWLRYVDDVYAIIKEEHLDDFHQHLNSMQASIKFTREKEVNGTVSFLDVTVTRKHDGSLITSVCRKPTHTGRYLPFDSHHPLSQKLSIPRTLFNRADNATLDKTPKQKEFRTIEATLKTNGCSRKFFNRRLIKKKQIDNDEKPTITTSLP